MTKRLLRRCRPAVLAAALALPLSAGAEELTGEVVLYGWLPAISGTLKTTHFKNSTEISEGDVLDALQFSAMGSAELHYGRWGFLADAVYSKTSTGGELPLALPFPTSTHVESKLLMLSGAALYRVAEWENGAWIEGLAGLRYISSKAEIQVDGPFGFSRKGSSEDDWVDPLIGVRGHVPLSASVGLTALADIGGFGLGSDLAWELFAGLDYALNERFVAKLGYRYLSIEQSQDGSRLDIDLHGPAIGMAARF